MLNGDVPLLQLGSVAVVTPGGRPFNKYIIDIISLRTCNNDNLRTVPNGDVPLLQLGSVAVVTPGGHTLAKHISIQVLPHRNLLVTGPNGSGKSAIFRVLRGLWPLVAGTISVAGDPAQWKLCSDVFYVPQQPYLSECSLLEQLIYPLALEGAPVVLIL